MLSSSPVDKWRNRCFKKLSLQSYRIRKWQNGLLFMVKYSRLLKIGYVCVTCINESFIHQNLVSHPWVRAGIYNGILLDGSSAFGSLKQYLNRCATLTFLKWKLKPEVRLLSRDHVTWYPGLLSLSPLVQLVGQA